MSKRIPRQRSASALLVVIALASQQACSAPTPPRPAEETRVMTAPAADAPMASAPVDTPAVEPSDPLPEPASPPAATADPPIVPAQPRTKNPVRSTPPAPSTTSEPVTVAIYTLSRGKGVPPTTREVYKQIRALLEQQQAEAVITSLQSSRIGLEGETRLCAEFRDRKGAAATLAQIYKLAAGIDLLNVVEESCPDNKEGKP